MAFQIIALALVISVDANQLLVERGAVIRQQAQQTEALAIAFSKRAACVEQRMVEQTVTGKARPGRLGRRLVGREHSFNHNSYTFAVAGLPLRTATGAYARVRSPR